MIKKTKHLKSLFFQKNGCDVNKGQSAVYGMLKFVPNDGIVDNFLIDLFDEIYKV